MGERRGTKALELWCRRMVGEGYKNVRVDNMTTSWRDGLAFCALVTKCSQLKQIPDLIHFDELKKEDIYHNNEVAFRVAEEYLGIPALLDPQDMLDYEIPDKLSILTYLSQFYQVFGAQENSIRLSKRSSTEANKSSASTPPAKMAHIPKRDPCVKCNNPVFFAERLVIEDHLYHRTCFRCARCESVLTLGNFYQTEKDNEYCCETCPDEEKHNRVTKVDESNRLSIAQRIALFEKTESSSVLKKSMSDEEKSKSLSRQLPSPANSSAFNSFLSSQINTQTKQNDSDDEKTIDSSSDDDSDDEPLSNPHKTEATMISEIKIATSSNDTIIKDNNVNATKELTHDDNAHATFEAHRSESQAKDPILDVVLNSDMSLHDEIELEFERLAEEAVNSQITPVSITIQKTISLENKPATAAAVNEVAQEFIESKPSKESSVANETQDDNPSKDIPKIDQEESLEVTQSEESQKIIPSQEIPEITPSQDEVISVEEKKVEEVIQDEELKDEINVLNTSKVLEESNEDKLNDSLYPGGLNPFGDVEEELKNKKTEPQKRPSLNPFGSCSEDEDENVLIRNKTGTLQKPPRPPPPRTTMTLKPASTNPFGSDDDEEESMTQNSAHVNKTPIPTPRRPLHSITPEPTPRANLSNHTSPGHSFKGSTSSLASSSDGMTMRRKKKKAPPPPSSMVTMSTNDLSSSENKMKTPSSTPMKKKRPAPTPPSSTPFKTPITDGTLYVTASEETITQNNSLTSDVNESTITNDSEINSEDITSESDQRRLIPLEESLIEEGSVGNSSNSHNESQEVTYRRKIVPLSPTSPDEINCENLEQIKDNKEAENRHRQSQSSLKADSTDSLPYINKSSHGKWKRRKGPAPALPGFALPQRRVLQMLPLQEIRHELEVIEVQQQGLEKQGVMLEKMIRERCEGVGDNRTTEELLEAVPNAKNPKEVEELILQLFEIVNEKNELFRRQAELMYLRRAHRLEEEQADVEYEIRKLMAQPEQNKTDSDKTKEEALIARLVEIVQSRNEVVDCLEMDRLREAEEDLSIKQRMESHTAKLDQEYLNQTPTKLSKKEKKKLKEAKKLKNKKLNDADKDLDTSEVKAETTEKKKKKKKFLF